MEHTHIYIHTHVLFLSFSYDRLESNTKLWSPSSYIYIEWAYKSCLVAEIAWQMLNAFSHNLESIATIITNIIPLPSKQIEKEKRKEQKKEMKKNCMLNFYIYMLWFFYFFIFREGTESSLKFYAAPSHSWFPAILKINQL